MNKSRHVVIAVECDLPPGVSIARFRQYVAVEIAANVGQIPPDDPSFHLDRSKVTAMNIPRDINWLLSRLSRGMDSPLYRRWFA